MLTAAHRVGEFVFTFSPPPTAQDVLDWKLWIQCLDGDELLHAAARQVAAGLQWACKWLEPRVLQTPEGLLAPPTPGALEVILDEIGPTAELTPWTAELLTVVLSKVLPDEERFTGAVGLCEAIADSAGLPEDVLGQLKLALDLRNLVDPEWTPPKSCTCTKCHWAGLGKTVNNPPGVLCLYEDIDPRAMLAASKVAELTDSGERWYVAQIRSITERAQARKWLWDEEQADKRAELEAEAAEINASRGRKPDQPVPLHSFRR